MHTDLRSALASYEREYHSYLYEKYQTFADVTGRLQDVEKKMSANSPQLTALLEDVQVRVYVCACVCEGREKGGRKMEERERK